MQYILTLVVVFSILLPGCSSVEDSSPGDNLQGTEWALRGASFTDAVVPSVMMLRFEEQGTLELSGRCLRAEGQYEVDSEAEKLTITITQVSSQSEQCTPEIEAFEQQIQSVINAADSYQVTHPSLVVTSGEAILSFLHPSLF